MPSHTYTTQVPIAGTVANILDGTPYLYLPRDAVMRIYAQQTGATVATPLLMDVMAGNTMLTTPAGYRINLGATAGQGPDKSRDLAIREPVRGGVPLVIRLRNTDPAVASDPSILVEWDWV
jgi:hypothetical protein